MPNCFAELTAAYGRMSERHRDYLVAAGVVLYASVTCEVKGEIGTYRTRTLCGAHPITAPDTKPDAAGCLGAYEPAAEGRNAVIVPVGVTGSDGLWDDIYDLVAFYLDAPHRWWLRCGEVLLGEEYVTASIDCGTPVRLVATPLDWLKAGGAAACIIDWRTADPRLLFQGVAGIECDTPELAKQIKKRIDALCRPAFKISAEQTVPVARRAPAAVPPRALPPVHPPRAHAPA